MWQKLRMQDLCIMVKPGILGRLLCTYLQPVPRVDEVTGCRHGRLSLLLVMKVIVRHFVWANLMRFYNCSCCHVDCHVSRYNLLILKYNPQSFVVAIFICNSRWEMVWFWVGPSSFTVVSQEAFVNWICTFYFPTPSCVSDKMNQSHWSITTSKSSPLYIKHWTQP
jgi:hypothetical protein